MCLLVARKTGSAWLPTEDEFSNAWSRNPDGVGVAWSDGGRVEVVKSLDKSQAWQAVQSIPSGAPALLHWRMGTAGSVRAGNCHPFPCLRSGWVAAHNGVLPVRAVGDLTDSESYLRSLSGRRPDVAGISAWLRKVSGGKIAFLSKLGELIIANAEAGTWTNGGTVWESNTSLHEPSVWWGSSGFGGRRGRCADESPNWGDWEPRRTRSRGWGSGLRAVECDGCRNGFVEWQAEDGRLFCHDCALVEEQSGQT